MDIAAVKPFTSICLLLIAVASLPLFATDGNVVTVKSSSLADGVVLIQAQVSNGDTTLQCIAGSAFCSAAPIGEYVMVGASSNESIYNDCTNVVLFRSVSGAKEKVGVYCWLGGGDCYVANCSPVQVSTVPSDNGSPMKNATAEKAAIKVADAATAVSIAEKAFVNVYGRKHVESEKPFTAILLNGIWQVSGTVSCRDKKDNVTAGACLGGTAEAQIRQRDGRILRVFHTK